MSRWAALLAAPLLLAGCAKYPDTGASGSSKRILLKMTVEGKVRTGLEAGGAGLPYVYIFALRLNTDVSPTTPGPLPVVVPGGNGFVAGNCTHYILWDPLRSPQYTIWKFNDAAMNDAVQVGVPLNYSTISPGDRTLFAEVDLSQLVDSASVDSIQSVQVNFLTMNNTLTSGSGRLWDALGDGRIASEINRPFLFNLRNGFTYTDANQGEIEPTGDSADPDLDIQDWSVEVRLN